MTPLPDFQITTTQGSGTVTDPLVCSRRFLKLTGDGFKHFILRLATYSLNLINKTATLHAWANIFIAAPQAPHLTKKNYR
jgi:hypothetical protein